MRTLLLSLLLVQLGHAQTLRYGAQSAALGGQRALVNEAAGSVFLNPALLANTPGWSFWSTYFRPFRLPGIQARAAAASFGWAGWAVGMAVSRWGNALYQDQLLRLALAGKLAGRLAIGITASRQSIVIERYGRYGRWSADIGVRFQLASGTELGLLIRHALYQKSKSMQEPPSRDIITALALHVSSRLRLLIELSREWRFEPELRLAAEIQPIPRLVLLAGTGFNTPEEVTVGLGLTTGWFRLQYALATHPVLPGTHVFAITLRSRP